MSDKHPPESIRDQMKRAAELRAAGYSWEVVARDINAEANVIKCWPELYPRHWEALYSSARRNAKQEGGAESHSTLRKMLRGEDDKSKLAAAALLLKPRPRSYASKPRLNPADRELADFVSQVKELSDEELEQSIRAFLATGGSAAGVADSSRAA